DKLAQTLYPWLPNSLQQMPQQFMQVNSTGIVFAVGERYSDIALLAIRALREVVKSKLPIEVMYAGNEDLSPETRAKFDGLPNVTTVDLYTYFTSEQDNLRGFYMKPFALVASSFRYPILLDADVLFMKDPRLVTESPHFAEYGQVFYTDRTLPWQFFWPWWGPFGFMPLFIERLRFMTIRSHHEMESGVVAVDKGRTKVLHALLLACKLNSRVERESLEPVFNSGDKETFWMAWELLRVPFRFAPGYSGMIGSKGSSFLLRNHVCGSMLHMDENLEPFWWNGGVYANKFQADSSMVEYTHAA
ncbi:alpha-mannosyltransferase, partial [Chytriomyces sp. MP71]